MNQPTLRVCYFGTYRHTYARNHIMITGLRRNGITVIECHESLWHSIEDRVAAVAGGWKRPSLWWRILRTYGRLLQRYWAIRTDYDILVTGYPGQFDVLLARLLSWWQRKPLVWDIFMSIYLIALERGLQRQNGPIMRLLRISEAFACRLPERLILDTDEYVAWFQATHGVAPERFRLVPTGADSEKFYPIEAPPRANELFRVIYYGTFIANHGVNTMIEAARLLRSDAAIQFELIGAGPEQAEALALAQHYNLTNVTFTEWLEPAGLMQRVAAADLCLGAFGTTPQSLMTIQNKIYEGLAMRRPVLTGDGPAVRGQLRHGEEIYLCARADPAALADAIRILWRDPALRLKVAQGGYVRFCADFTLDKLGARFASHLREVQVAAGKRR